MHLCLSLYATFVGLTAVALSSVSQDSGVITVKEGDIVTLHCEYDSQVAMHFSWYIQRLGSSPVVLSTVYKYDEPSRKLVWLEKYPRFAVQRQEGKNHLHISDAQPQDSALYFCASSHSNVVEFGQGVFLSVRASSSKQVVQGPAMEVLDPGSSVTLNCSVRAGACTEEHSVYWFKHGSLQGILYTDGDYCRRRGPKSGSQSCTYHLQRTNVSWTDSGTYYCAVALCGDVLFGNGTVLQVTGEGRGLQGDIRLLVWLSLIRTGVLLLCVCFCLVTYFIRSR